MSNTTCSGVSGIDGLKVDMDPTVIMFGDKRNYVPGYLGNQGCFRKKVIGFLVKNHVAQRKTPSIYSFCTSAKEHFSWSKILNTQNLGKTKLC
jgi:hypothetical protein